MAEELRPPGGAELHPEAERERPEERERRERQVPRTLEIISHEGADHLAMRRAVRTMLSTMQEGTERFSSYSVEYLGEALDNRVWNLPEEGERSPQDKEVAEEAEALKAEVTARENIQGAYYNWNQFGGDVGEYSGLFLRTWLKFAPTAGDFSVVGNLSETPGRIEPIEVKPRPVVELEEVIDEVIDEETGEPKIDEKTGKPMRVVRRRRRTRTREGVIELVGYKGEVKEGEKKLGLKVDEALRAYVHLAVAKAPEWFLKEKVFKELSSEEITEKKRQAIEALGITEGELEGLSSLGADVPIEGRIVRAREFIAKLVGDKDAEEMAYKLVYIWELATKFGVRGSEKDFEIEGFPASSDLIKLAHVELRRNSEASENRKAGPPSTLGCYPDLIVSFLDFAKVERPTPEDPERKVSFWELWYERKEDKGKKIESFGDLPWDEVRRNIFDSDMYHRWRANNVLEAIMKVTNWDLGKELYDPEYLRGLNKDIQVTVGMLRYPDEAEKKIMKGVKFNILGGAIVSNLPTSFLRDVKENPPEVVEPQRWTEVTHEASQVILSTIKYSVVKRAKFFSEEEWKECIEQVVQPRVGVKIRI